MSHWNAISWMMQPDIKSTLELFTCCRVSTLREKYSRSVFTASAVAALALLYHFQDCYCYSNSHVMCYVTKYCNVIVLHCTVRQDTACIRSSTDPSLFVGLACETKYNAGASESTSIVLLKILMCDSLTQHIRKQFWLARQLQFCWNSMHPHWLHP